MDSGGVRVASGGQMAGLLRGCGQKAACCDWVFVHVSSLQNGSGSCTNNFGIL